MTVEVGILVVADPPQAWSEAGFTVGPDAQCQVGGVGIRLVGRDHGTGIIGWSLRGIASDIAELDGIPTRAVDGSPSGRPGAHPNGVLSIDHIVWMSQNLSRTTACLAQVGVQARRERETTLAGRPIRQIFFRFGEVIVEVVGSPETAGDGPSSLWGITYTVADIDATAAFLGDRAAPVKDAVQPGRRITTLRHDAFGMSVRTAVISPPILTA
ncbi:glyoxalase [Mycobacterium sp. WMMD1722]|uniref:glyoxalase n=1 Tax=Mycobacterium sp. WMMD1722 TaxID=3404117 RepID=UPI003BF5D132